MKTLIMFSGGLDSTVALLKLLTETNDELHVHHINLINKEGRAEAEKIAVSKIIPYCQKIRPFVYTTTTQDYTEIYTPYDTHVTRYTASQICRGNSGINRVVSGHCKDDTNSNVVSDAIFKAALCGNPDKIEWYYPCSQMSKYDERQYLLENHPDLLDMIHYCRRPIKNGDKWDNCNKCTTCIQMSNLHWQYIREGS
jgi:tRNA(Ile)-lysidine synthase TilS/MesJ